MKVIFLDVDGVLNSDEYFDKRIGIKDEGNLEDLVDIEKVNLLKKAVDTTGAKIVLTTSIRYKKIAGPLIELLNQYKMLLGMTPYIDNKRGIEIKQWLVEHPEIKDFIILDDEIFDSYDEKLMKKLIKISDGNGMNFGEGLQSKDVEEIIKRLGKQKQIEELEI